AWRHRGIRRIAAECTGCPPRVGCRTSHGLADPVRAPIIGASAGIGGSRDAAAISRSGGTMSAQPQTSAAGASEALVTVEHEGPVARVTLNRPAQFNALSEALMDALQGALDRIAADEAVRVVVLGAAGKAFCAGH